MSSGPRPQTGRPQITLTDVTIHLPFPHPCFLMKVRHILQNICMSRHIAQSTEAALWAPSIYRWLRSCESDFRISLGQWTLYEYSTSAPVPLLLYCESIPQESGSDWQTITVVVGCHAKHAYIYFELSQAPRGPLGRREESKIAGDLS
jgi:hypothetical protein